VIVSAERGDGLDALRKSVYDVLGVMRIYTKQPGKPADMTSPFTPPIGATVAELAGKVHRDLEDAVKSARVWGASVHDGQTVGRDHVLHDKDVVELHT
jgi:ribosome-interacting GTPase 1